MGSNRAIRALVELRRGSGEALHSQLEGALRAAIRTRRLAPGSRVPTSRQLAADLGVTRRVVVEAYEQLAAEGYLLTRRGAGTWVALDVACREAEPASITAGAGPVPEIDLRPGGPDLALFPRTQWAAALRSVILGRSHRDLGYDHPTGHPDARTTVAGWLTRTRAAMVGADDLILVSGVAQALDLTARVLIPRGLDMLAVEDPGHPDQRCDDWASP